MNEDLLKAEISDLLYQLKEEIDGEFVGLTDEVYTVRSATAKVINGKEIFPIVDFFFTNPPLSDELKTMKIVEAKKMFFELVENLSDSENNDELKEVIQEHISCLKDYTANNNKRNENLCYIVAAKDSMFPMMVYFEEDEILPELTKITVEDLLTELEGCLA